MGMTIDEAIKRYKNNAEYERTHGNLQGCLEFRQLADWLRKYQKIEQIYKEWFSDKGRTSADAYIRIGEVVEDGTN